MMQQRIYDQERSVRYGYINTECTNIWLDYYLCVSSPTSFWLFWPFVGCYSDFLTQQTLNFYIDVLSLTMALESCIFAYLWNGHSIAGVEYSSGCYGNNVLRGGGPVADGCSMSCARNVGEKCGCANRLSLYSSSLKV